MNKSLSKAKKPKEFRRWLIRQYFSEDKNIDKPWYKASVDENNVLDYISDCKNNFPLTPTQIVGMWNTLSSFKKGYKSSQKDFDAYVLQEDKERPLKVRKPNNMEYTLEEIGQELGGITATMINRLAASAMMKFKTLTFDKPFDQMTKEEFALHKQAIQTFRERAADKYVKALKTSKGNLNVFFANIQSSMVMTAKEVELVLSQEFDTIILLSSLKEEEIKEFLLDDIARKSNVVTSYQCMVAKEAFPTKKRGRPRKHA